MSGPDLRHGHYQEVFADLKACDAVISDPPYGGRTHEGQEVNRDDGSTGLASEGLGYAHWTPANVREFVDFWAPRNRGWFAVQTSHDLCPAWEDAYRAAGLTTFAPVPCVMRGMSVRLAGDGPSSWAVWLMVARPKALSKWGTLRGAYEGDERPLAECPTCSFDPGASDDVGPGERARLCELLGAREGESLVQAAERVAGERVDAMSEAQAWRDARRLLRLLGLSRGEA